MTRWWQSLSERDRRVLGVGVGVTALLLFYALVWMPLQESRSAWRQRAEAADQAWLWMQHASERLSGRAPPPVAGDGRSLLAQVDASAREAGLGGVLLRVEPISSEQVRVTFQSVAFDGLMDWLQRLQSTQGVRVEELSVQRAAGVGLVDARVGLGRAAAR